MFGLFRKKIKFPKDSPKLTTDIHSHLLPELDDGSGSLEESMYMIKAFADQGFKKLITTPHIMSDVYRNTPDTIRAKLDIVREEITKQGIDIELDIAAEYYLDEALMRMLENEEKLLSFGDNYLLFETSYMAKPNTLNEAIFLMQSLGYKPVMAHPERYVYYFNDYEAIKEVKEKGVYLQVNIGSITGYYSKPSQKIAQKLIQDQLVSFLGSDCHKPKHFDVLQKTLEAPYFKLAMSQNILNNSL